MAEETTIIQSDATIIQPEEGVPETITNVERVPVLDPSDISAGIRVF